jgi:hypothetical protein
MEAIAFFFKNQVYDDRKSGSEEERKREYEQKIHSELQNFIAS